LDDVAPEMLFDVSFENAFFWVLKTPICKIVIYTLKLANLSILVDHFDQSIKSKLSFSQRNLPRVFTSSFKSFTNRNVIIVNPVTETLIRDNCGSFLI